MNTDIFSTEAVNIWKKAASESTPDQLRLEIDLYKKLLNIFQVGDYFYWIFNLAEVRLEIVSKEITQVLGYEPGEFNIQLLMTAIHPEDRPYFLNFESKTRAFLSALPVEKLMKYKVRHDYRMRKKDGSYARILYQVIVIEHDNDGQILRTLGVCTDITHLKPEGKPLLSYIGLDGEPSYINVDVTKIFAVSKEFLSKREKQILLLIMEGKLSKEISELLHISKQTVDTHRNNMIEKNGLRNTSELITKAIRQGWI